MTSAPVRSSIWNSDLVPSFLYTLYAQPHRKYHNNEHIERCVHELADYMDDNPLDEVSVREAMLMILFHDAVYDPATQNAGDDEFLSLCLFEGVEQYIDFGITEKSKQIISQGIAWSAKHTEKINEKKTDSQKIFLDIDLVGLADDYEAFLATGDQIREEYAHVNDNDFMVGRTNFFKALIKRGKLYYTEYFLTKCQDKAVNNINRWLNEYGTAETK